MKSYAENDIKFIKYIFCVCNNCNGINIAFKPKDEFHVKKNLAYDFSTNTCSKETSRDKNRLVNETLKLLRAEEEFEERYQIDMKEFQETWIKHKI